MENIILMNESFNKNKINESELSYENKTIYIKKNKNGIITDYQISSKEITHINLVFSRCPKPLFRFLCLSLEAIAIILLILAIVFWYISHTVSFIIGGFGIALFILCLIITRIIFKKSPFAIEVLFKTSNKKYYLRAYNSNDKEFGKVSKITRQVKKDNNLIILDVNTRR